MDYSQYPQRPILCVDMKSFYASIAAVQRGLDPLTCYLAVVGNTDQQGSFVLAASPALKRDFKIKTGARLYEIPNDPRIHIVNPAMSTFLRVSTEITKLFFRYVPPDAVHTYSVDESFLDAKGLTRIWGTTEDLAKRIKADIMKTFGLPCAIGIGPNMLMAKLCLDLEAKKATGGIAKWTYDDVQTKLWPVRPLSNMWGIGKKLEGTLNRMGIFSVGQLAKTEITYLERRFGVIGNQLYYHSWGIDLSELGNAHSINSQQKSYGMSQILMRDYNQLNEIKHVVLEMCEEVARRARKAKKAGQTISFGLGYSKNEFGGGFHRSRTIEQPTNVTMDLYHVCLQLLHENYTGKTVRQITVSISNLVDDYEVQLDLFDENGWRKRQLGYTMDQIRDKYGAAALLRAVSYTPAGTALKRAKLVGGHSS